MRRLLGRPILWPPSDTCPFPLNSSATESWHSPRSGTVKEFGVSGSAETILFSSFDEGSKNLTRGFVIKPKTCKERRKDCWFYLGLSVCEMGLQGLEWFAGYKGRLMKQVHNQSTHQRKWQIDIYYYLNLLIPYHSADKHNCYCTGDHDSISAFWSMASSSKLQEQN